MQTSKSTNSVAPSSSAAPDQSLVHAPTGPSGLVRTQPSTRQVPQQSSSWRMSEPFKFFTDSPAITPLPNRAIPPVWIKQAPSDQWQALINGCIPFEIQNENLWTIVETFRRGEGSLTKHIAELAKWKPLTGGTRNREIEVAERDGMYFYHMKGYGVQEFTVTTGVNEETHSTNALIMDNCEERFEYTRSTAGKLSSTQLELYSRTGPKCFSHWCFYSPELGAPSVLAEQCCVVRPGSLHKKNRFIANPTRTDGGIALSFHPSDLKPFTQHPHLSRLRDVTSTSK